MKLAGMLYNEFFVGCTTVFPFTSVSIMRVKQTAEFKTLAFDCILMLFSNQVLEHK